jgi:N-acetylglucosaminyldiphosphoundecaprenol N-acetyl-beta-D-mannosaminyltransferase
MDYSMPCDLSEQTQLSPPAWLLGLPISSRNAEESVETLINWAREESDHCRFVSTSNVDFLVNALAWTPWRVRHPELLDVLRASDMNTADGMPLVWATRLLGGNIPERVSGSDLIPSLARSAGRSNISIYLLGGNKETTQRAAQVLLHDNPDLLIAGMDCPFVCTEGGGIAFENENDRQICDKINSSGAQLLLIGFGNPKQEMWFQRNRSRLRTNVAMGVGGTFNFIAGDVLRAPPWMQKAGLEWVFRFLEEPKRLWKRYAVGLAKFSIMLAPPLAIHFLFKTFLRERGGALRKRLFFSGEEIVQVIVLPDHLNAKSIRSVYQWLEEEIDAILVLDASECRCVDAAGLGFLWQMLSDHHDKGCYIYAPSLFFRFLCRIHRATDFIAPLTCQRLPELLARIAEKLPQAGSFASLESVGDSVSVSFLGSLVANDLKEIHRDELVQAMGQGKLTIDLRYCSRIDSDGLAFLAQLLTYTRENGFDAAIYGYNRSVKASIEVAGLGKALLKSAPRTRKKSNLKTVPKGS